MKKLDTNKLTDKQIKFFNEHLAYMATVNKEGKPDVGPKGSLKAIDANTLQYLEKTKSEAYDNLKNGSEAAIVVADAPTHKAFRVRGYAETHEGDDYAKKILKDTKFPNAYVVNIKIDEIDA
ncbi:pyridoxamine 5'-phosphate oxidase family protein [Lactobacillus kefiranofaciens]|uniref:Pyridoxamine 5'-phosphate oxidase family protein n=1 Tax=Lactobacillus kefiranofaciens TaxID=267818 RepID=A0AAX3UG49_9LACO|nr:pyridoxamine 5'-phosphate oxidase family protein [Lactobacillus kefiranofaciens]AEG40005.1 Pyridoxine 5'-phosphate oxidase V related favin-nucleotide-binding protein [Lactobacillus kefiranofaciens subsp. kefiranofaciens]KRM21274.1 pyridoxine 5-phosphate oxidase V related favin-nucleotide-binding protein [Lactobacillus kefiranofaciens subsp. kefiranofaciens DSM 5016 = JCM 6985]MCP9331568.1 pyridoxamine 5'-phosphate oxidase family protein [Lactobacillus kefiranofaciens]MDF4141707.1 pyridoxamin